MDSDGHIQEPKYAELLKAAHIRSGLTQSQLANKVGSHQSAVSHWERGDQAPSETTKQKLDEVPAIRATSGYDDGGGGAADAGTSPFGQWLNKTRDDQGLTVGELAQASGVSIPRSTTLRQAGHETLSRQRETD